ncbi:LLM class flavin-dependent oxidoreductase [Salisediminibacterium halotolerans]|uniref:Luciferase family oxidoreductase, group 1 n=1 Tax=Salisediminibacterium halotolerans TaxID=517425 RepID=A0A1H9UGW7_9BACI|nr:LLM class flavin-dependent oxidoreductase [Salisediminibacterium haloalkalitolerans]SES08518.1 luciferase family oxidoreductase, group 1 [Salisediminibacterium haloalkalitolerans]
MKLSILDQSPIAKGRTAKDALNETEELANLAERWGFHRFWVSEHHDSGALAGTSPEILLARLGAKTSTIRIGSGGVMLPHYSPFKTAENFRMLEALYPGRVDLGIGRAPGGMPVASWALSEGRPRNASRFPQQVDHLLMYLRDQADETHPYPNVQAGPVIDTVPPVWILGSSPGSAALAAEKGLPYTFAHFINGDGGRDYMAEYLTGFTPGVQAEKPQNMAAVFVVCADTEAKAEYIAKSFDLSLLMLLKGEKSSGTPSPSEAEKIELSNFEAEQIKENRKRMIVGTPDLVREQLQQFAADYQTDEVMIVTITYDQDDRFRSYELIQSLGLHEKRSPDS